MKLKKYLPFMAFAALLASCAEEPELPPVKGPVATYTANTTILELKQQFWKSDANYVSEIGLTENGDSIIIKGTVISSDSTGNIYKSLMIADTTAALTVAVDAYDLYQTYQYGQELYINCTGLHIGGYNSLMQLGGEGDYKGNPSMTFMEEEDMTAHAQQNGWGNPANVAQHLKVADIPTLQAAKASAESMQKWQSQLVRLDSVSFEDAGQQFAPSKTTNRYVKDAAGNRMNVRCSSYSDFAGDTIPSGTGSVTAILSYYGSDWQMMLINIAGLQGFDTIPSGSTPTPPAEGEGDGTKAKPFTVGQLLAMGNPETQGQWATGVIVGVMNFVDGTGNVFSATELTTNSNIVIAATAANYGTNYVAVQLPQGEVRSTLNLVDHPELMGKTVSVCGTLSKYCGITGVRDVSMAILDGKEIGSEPVVGADIKFTRATTIGSGGKYAFWTDNTVALPYAAGTNYGYMKVADCNLTNETTLTTASTNAFLFTQHAKGWTIQDSNGQYLWTDAEHNSFQVSAEFDEANEAYYWALTKTADDRFEIVNVSTAKLIQYSLQYTSYGAYPERDRGSLPFLYQAEN